MADYELWAKQVTGIEKAYAKRNINGAGTVGIYIVTKDSELKTKVEENINNKKPVGAEIYVLEPADQAIEIAVNITPNNSDNDTRLRAALLELPEKCNRHTQDINNISLSERQLNALNKYLNKSLNTKQYIIDYAKTLGYEIEIEELREAKFDEEFSTFSSGDEANTINIIVTNIEKVRSCFGDFFDQDFGLIEQDNHVECMLDKIIPAHIQVVYTYK